MPTSRTIDQRSAGDEHEVLTVEDASGAGRYRRAPCPACPWRRDATGLFPPDAFRHAANTATDGAHVDAVGIERAAHTFACHQSGAGKPATCAGYIARGADAISWRLGLAAGKFDPQKVSDGGLDLFANYHEMAVANGVPPDDPVLVPCRPWKPAP